MVARGKYGGVAGGWQGGCGDGWETEMQKCGLEVGWERKQPALQEPVDFLDSVRRLFTQTFRSGCLC